MTGVLCNEEARRYASGACVKREAAGTAGSARNVQVPGPAKHDLARIQDHRQTMTEKLEASEAAFRTSQQELSQLRKEFHRVLEASQVLILSLDQELRIDRFSPQLSKLFDIDADDDGRPILDVECRLHYPELAHDLEQARDGGVSQERELSDADGRRYLARVLPKVSTDDRVESVVLTFTEIPEREADIITNEARLRAIVHASSSALFRVSADWTTLLQLTSDGLLTETSEARTDWRETYLHPDDIETIEAAIKASLRTTDVFELEYRVRRRDGRFGWVFGRAVPILDEDGQVIEWVGTASDVTDRKLDEDDLRTSEAHYRNLAELSPEAILVCKDDRIVFANRRAAELLGREASDELIG